jgi:ABC-2 type transport system ATP-binding protein
MDEAERCHEIAMIDRGKLLIQGMPRSLEDDFPYGVVEARSIPREVASNAARSSKYLIDQRSVGDRQRIYTEHPEKLMRKMKDEIDKNGAKVSILRSTRPSMEDLFIYYAAKNKVQV